MDAKRAVQRLYRGDCNNALEHGFTEDVNRMRDRTFPHSARNWRDRAYNECGRDAIRKELDRIGRRCRNSHQAAGDCSELGETAATIIVDDSGVCPAERHFRRQRKRNNLRSSVKNAVVLHMDSARDTLTMLSVIVVEMV